MLANLMDRLRDIGGRIWFLLLALAIGGAIIYVLSRDNESISPEIVQLTIEAASTQSNQYVPTLAANLTLTPAEAAVTAAAPTLSLSGQQLVRQFAASALADSQVSDLDWGAVQATGPPDTPECGDFPTAWATAQPDERGTLTLYFAQLVTPVEVRVYQTFNPGFIVQVTLTDVFGETHTVYTAAPQPAPLCPDTLVIPVSDAGYPANIVTITVDQTASVGGWNQIDAVELVGIKY